MSRILFGWELGGGHGHVRTLLPIARGLVALGHAPVFAVRNVADVWPVFRSEGFPVLAAPVWHRRNARVRGPYRVRTFADVLAFNGWGEPDELEGMLSAWDSTIEMVRPDLVVLDYAPSLCLATRGRIPTVQVGTGYSVPPDHLPEFPVMNPKAELILPEPVMVDSIRIAQARRGFAAPASLPALFDDATRLLTILPELDPYAGNRRETPVGPVDALPDPVPPPRSPRWFAYLTADQDAAEQVLLDFARSGIPGEAYVRGSTRALREKLSAAGIQIHETPAPMREVLPRVSVVVHNGGIGLASTALAAGRPQILFPQHIEQKLTAELLSRMGVALTGSQEELPASVLRRMVKGALFMMEAQERAESIRKAGPRSAVARTLEAIVGKLPSAR